jgi:hypothetical protein
MLVRLLILWRFMRPRLVFAFSIVVLVSTGCHSPYVDATVSNHTTQSIELLEVDYPSASFGTQNLSAGAEFHYRFKVLGSGATKLLYTDSAHHDHTFDGPSLSEGAEGTFSMIITSSGVSWQPAPTVVAAH